MLRTARKLIANVYTAAAICWLAFSANFSLAVVIDDFQVGAITVVGPSVQTQTGLDPSHVLGGSRAMNVGQSGAGSVLSIDPQVGLKLESSGRGYFNIKYDFAPAGQGIDLTQGAQDRFRLNFGDITTGFTPLGLYATLPSNSSSNGISVYAGNWSGMILEFPFAKFPVSLAETQSLTLDVARNPAGASLVVKSITTAGQPLAGDYNRDGTVDSADYLVWRQFVGVNTKTNSIFPIASADGDGNGAVDAADYIIWRKNLGTGSAAGSTANYFVPEPAAVSIVLYALANLSLLLVRRRRRSS
jgi:hypothetical protein